MMAAEDPLSYVFHVLNYVSSTNPATSESDKVNRLFDGLPTSLKSAFVRDPPKTVQEFTDRLKDTAVKPLTPKRRYLRACWYPD